MSSVFEMEKRLELAEQRIADLSQQIENQAARQAASEAIFTHIIPLCLSMFDLPLKLELLSAVRSDLKVSVSRGGRPLGENAQGRLVAEEHLNAIADQMEKIIRAGSS
jgi:hypothetical protein